MFGLTLVLTATFFKEISETIGKREMNRRSVSVYTFGFLDIFWSVPVYFFIAFFIRQQFLFAAASWPTFGLRLMLELVQAHVTVKAIERADRSTFTFLRTLTLPLLLLVDVLLGYQLNLPQIIGVSVIAFTLLFLFWGVRINRLGAGLVLFTAVNAVATLSLYKYNITHFNSVEAEQGLIAVAILLYFLVMARWRAGENALLFLRRPLFLGQSLASGLSGVVMAFAYLFGPASVITAAKRGFSLLWSIVSGHHYFTEKKLAQKFFVLLLISLGLWLLVF